VWTRAPLIGKPFKSMNRTNSLTIQRTRKKLRSAERRALVKIGEKNRKSASSRLNSTITHSKTSELNSTSLSTSSCFSFDQAFFSHAVLSWASASTGRQELWLPPERTLDWLLSCTGIIISNLFVFGNVCKLMTNSLHRTLDRREGWESRVNLDP